MTTTKKILKNALQPTMVKVSELTTVQKARLAVSPSFNGATVIQAYQGNVMGKDVDLSGLIDQLRDTFTEVKGGDLHTLEAMLISQATALQTIFTSLARRACTQDRLPQYQTFLGLALKAQAQSRATITALVDLKYPRQATFVKQANIANGPQQVNNGAAAADPAQNARARVHGTIRTRAKQTIGGKPWATRQKDGHQSGANGRAKLSGGGNRGNSPPGQKAPRVGRRWRAMPGRAGIG